MKGVGGVDRLPRGVLWALLFVPIVAALIVLSLPASASNDPPPGGGTVSGDWTVEDARAYDGCTITLRGNLTVLSTGKLELNGAKIRLDCASHGDFGIEVKSGGELKLRAGAVIEPVGEQRYRFIVREGGAMNATDATIKGCGWTWGESGEKAGLYVLSELCGFARTTFTNSYYGVLVRGASPLFKECGFVSNTYGAGLINSSAAFENCTFRSNAHGANLEGSPAAFRNCTFYYQSAFGILAYASPIQVSGCDLAYSTAGHIVLMQSEASVSGCTMREGAYGVYVAQGSPAISNCTFTADRYGIYLYKSGASVRDCVMDSCTWYGVAGYYGAPEISRCKVTRTGYSSVDGQCYGTGALAVFSDMKFSDCIFQQNYQGVECRNSRPGFVNVTARENAIGVNSLTSTVNMTACVFSDNTQAGVFINYFSGGSVRRCGFIGGKIGLYAEYFSTPEVSNCTFSGCREGLRASGCDRGMVVRECTFDNDSTGIVLDGGGPQILSNTFISCSNHSLLGMGSSPEIRNNIFSSSTFDSVTLTDSGGRLANNTFKGNGGAGLYCVDSTTEVENNTFTGNSGSAIYCYGKRCSPRVHHNLLAGNELGIALSGGAGGEYWCNTLVGNRVMGFSISASVGIIHNNNISGSERGISCLYGSAPSVYENEIHGCEGGISCHVSSDAVVWKNRLWNNTRFGVSVIGSSPVLVENFIEGGLDGIAVDDCSGGGVMISLCSLRNATDGLRAENSSLELRGCTFSGNSHFGVYLYSSDAVLSQCRFEHNAGGACGDGGSVRAVECEFVDNNGSALQLENARAWVERCLFERNGDGVLDVGGSTLQVIDGQYRDNLGYAIHCGEGTVGDWRIVSSSSLTAERVKLAGNLTVSSGAFLRLTNVTLFMALRYSGQYAILVEDEGRLEFIDGCTVAAIPPSSKYHFRILRGGALTFTDGVLQDCGEDWGAAGESGGLNLLSDNVTLCNVAFINCTHGLIANGIRASFSGLSFSHCRVALVAVASSLRVENSSIYLSGYLDLDLQQGSRLVTLNTTFTRSKVRLAGPGTYLEVIWLLNVNAAWQTRVPVERGQILLIDAEGRSLFAGLTDERGWLLGIQVIEYVQTAQDRREKNPYKLSVRFADVSTSVERTFEASETIYVILNDLQPPQIELMNPPDGALLNYTPVLVTGLAADYETGLALVEASEDGRVWAEVRGLEQWSFSFALSDGHYTLYIRATDAAGNRAICLLNVTVDTQITLLEITEPQEGEVTRERAVSVRGLTEVDAKILVNGRRALLYNGAFCVTVELSEGANTILVSALDAAGNSATITRTVFLDTVPPFIDIASPLNGSYTPISEARLYGRTEPGARVLVEGREVLCINGVFSEILPLPAPDNFINITVIDSAGNTNSTVLELHVDTETPDILIGSPICGFRTAKRNVTINGTTEPFALISTGEAMTVAGPDGAFALNIDLLPGNNTIILRAADRAGNENTLVWFIVRTKREARTPSPWVETIATVALVLALENALIYVLRRRGRGRRRVESPPLATTRMGGGEPAEAMPWKGPVDYQEEAPPEAQPVEWEEERSTSSERGRGV
ncbi:MAG: right-handed parallel beta-helix repeat-containing protein [Thermoplasmata archaeon]